MTTEQWDAYWMGAIAGAVQMMTLLIVMGWLGWR
jgi:hypothetical protein